MTEQASQCLLLTLNALNQRNWPAVQRHAQDCLKEDGPEGHVYAVLALANANLGQQDEALRLAETARQSDPEDNKVLMLVAETLLLCGQHDHAEKVLETTRRLDPQNRNCLALLCAAAIRRNDPVALADRIDDLAKVHFVEADILRCQGALALMLNEPEVAETCYRAVLREEPEDFSAHFKLAEIFFFRGDARTAHMHAASAANLDPENLLARNLVKSLARANSRIHRIWFRMSLWMVLPRYQIARLLISGVILFATFRVPPVAGLFVAIYLTLSLTGRWYISGIQKTILAQERRVDLSLDY